MRSRPSEVGDATALARLHASAFDAPWSAADIADLLAQPGVFGRHDGDGFILIRVVADEAEVLTLAVAPQARRRGLARALLASAQYEAGRQGAQAMFLEVAADNDPALGLYRSAGFEQVGRRPRYYAGGADALILRRDLNSLGG